MTVTAVNKVGLTTTAFSRCLLVDNTPPQVCVKNLHLNYCENCLSLTVDTLPVVIGGSICYLPTSV